MSALFELTDFAVKPAHAEGCFYCRQSTLTGEWPTLEHHEAQHLPITCVICGGTKPNRLLFDMSHGVNLGAILENNALLCTALSLQLNHLTYDIREGREPAQMDLRALELGWRIAPDGSQIPPAGWPTADTATWPVLHEAQMPLSMRGAA